jgi:hypothetical protein
MKKVFQIKFYLQVIRNEQEEKKRGKRTSESWFVALGINITEQKKTRWGKTHGRIMIYLTRKYEVTSFF